MKRLLMITVLACVIPVSTLAGDIPSDGFTATPDESTLMTGTTPPREIPTVGYTAETSNTTLDLIDLIVGLMI